MSNNWKKRLICWAIPLAVGGLAALLSGGMRSYQVINQPPLSPPGWVFPVVWTVLYIPCPYTFYERMKLEVAAFDGIIRDTQFGAEVELEILVAEQKAQLFLDSITDMTSGTVEIMQIGKEYRAFPVEQE